MNRERERVRLAQAELDEAVGRLERKQRALAALVRERRLPWLVGGGFAAGFLAALFPLRAWPPFVANLARTGWRVAGLPIAPALLALAARNLRRKGATESPRPPE